MNWSKQWGFSLLPKHPDRNRFSIPWRKVSSHVAPLLILWILRERSQFLTGPRDTGVCCLDCGAGTCGGDFQSLVNDCAWASGRCKTHYLPGAEYATWVGWSPGTVKNAIWSRDVSIRVLLTTLSASALIWASSPRVAHSLGPRLFGWSPQGPFTIPCAALQRILQPQATPHTPAPTSLPSPLSLPQKS